MNLYIAGLYTSNFGLKSNLFRGCPRNIQMLREQVTHHLESYHYIGKGKFAEHIRRDGVKVFLDSGAFSAFSLGVEVSVEEYADFIKSNQDIILMASVLDAIGDHNGTWQNQQKLEALGCDVLPCYHYGEPFEVCEYYAANYEYMTIGGMVPVPNQKLKPWLDELWARVLTDKDGIAKTKVHGFGLTSRPLMQAYPWYSVDSSSWVQAAANGNIFLPEFQSIITASEAAPQKKKLGQHLANMPEANRKRINELLEYYGLTEEDVATNYKARWALNAFTFDRVGKAMGDDHWRKPFRNTQGYLT